ncbi:unnamed protein product [Bursaphelenchus xylophilus]|uniref:(pine wood nematode) hypothetical protein n=1 Tax=Bursaphelenchus xylophilus TaxID=6326 RepID=A0A1I7SH38_BURXY|nr:unnamed protein product [Bursaphelenchus xylophilus]CAG9102131.1 unnamed protein product [Bursaphelenchus xylophilus]
MEEIVVVDNPKPWVWSEIAERVAETEGWAVSDNDYNCWRSAFGDDFILRVFLTKDDKFICSLAIATYPSADPEGSPLTTVGMFYTAPEFRGNDFGTQMFFDLVEREEHNGHNKGLIGVEAMASKYAARHGFDKESGFVWDCYINDGTDFKPENLERHPDIVIKRALDTDFEKLVAYDQTIAGKIDRRKYLNSGIRVLQSYSLAALNPAGEVIGLLRGRICAQYQLYIGPLYADSPEIAESLLHEIFVNTPRKPNLFTKIVIAAPSTNLEFVKLWSKFCGREAKKAGSMHSQFTKEVLQVPTERVFGIFDYCMSYV